jgi:hypothetical protein
VLVSVAVVAFTSVGCGLGPGNAKKGPAELRVTRDFGRSDLHVNITKNGVRESDTVMRLLQSKAKVTTRYGGGFVQSIGKLAGGARRDWFFYVNGIEAHIGAAATKVHAGDRIWWDFHDWRATQSVPAVVGAFPEPFVRGIGGKRYPTTLECAGGVAAACRSVSTALGRIGVPAPTQYFGTGSGTDSLNILVAPWTKVRATIVGSLIQHGPGSSGIYARFSADGRRLELLDPSGAVVRALGPSAGLVAASADMSGTPTWIVTGTDAAGVRAAAALLDQSHLQHHFALAVGPGTGPVALPLGASR